MDLLKQHDDLLGILMNSYTSFDSKVHVLTAKKMHVAVFWIAFPSSP